MATANLSRLHTNKLKKGTGMFACPTAVLNNFGHISNLQLKGHALDNLAI